MHTDVPLIQRARRAACALTIGLALGACASPVGVRKTGFEPVFVERSANVLTNGELSASSREMLSALGLLSEYRSDPDAALTKLEPMACREGRRLPFALLAELQYARAIETEQPGDFLAAAISAYLFLFCDELRPAPDPYDPRFRLACDIHNRALARALMGESGTISLSDRMFETRLGQVEIEASRPGFPWSEDVFGQFLPADIFQVRGLRERVRTPGLGVPLIAIRNPASTSGQRTAEHMGADAKLSATAVLELEGGLDALRARHMRASLKLYLATDTPRISLSGHEVPLERDLTVALAYTLESSRLWGFWLWGFLGGSRAHYSPGVFLVQPYQRGKIPVVLVHGTASTPAVWAQLVNGLNLDHELHGRYQVWVAIYRTGTPILLNAAQIRDSLASLVADLDPLRTDPALERIVVVGHSQGGLVARLLVTSSGERYWSQISSQPFDQYPLSDDERKLAKRTFFFEPLPFVERVVFISTPHRGSFVAEHWIGRLTRSLISLPSEVTAVGRDLLKGDRLPLELREGIPDSVMNMEPDSTFVRTLGTLPFDPDVHLHSIVSVKGSGPAEEGDDGVVRYTSAHLDQAESELVVRHGHSCQSEPATILELRRILLEHFAAGATAARLGGD